MTTIAQAKFESIPKVRPLINLEAGLAVFLLGIVFAIRITNLHYNTLFVDEAIYATVGREILSGHDLQASASWMFGSYLYPIVAALTNSAAGVVGMRGLSAVLSTVSVL